MQQRLQQYGPNRLKSAPETPWWKRLLEQFENFLVIILLVAVVISVIEWVLQDPRESALPYEAIVIMAIVVLNAMLGFIQESRAEKSVRALMALAAPEATVVRDGDRQRVATHDIVPGDIVLIEAGDKIPADSRLVEVANLQTDEAPLTGESVPVSKELKPIEGDTGLGDRRNMLFSGTVATYGRGRAVVVATGMSTEVGRIAGLLEAAEKEPTPLQQELDRTGKRLSVIMLGICAVVFAAGLFSTTTFTLNVVLGLFLFAVALAVAAIPEALPAIVTVGLSLGVRRMAAANAIVRKLPAVETLGAATVICSDKTGTLTRNEMTLRAIATADTLIDIGGSGYIPEGDFTIEGKKIDGRSPHRDAVAELLQAAALANDAALVQREGRWMVQGDPTEGALVVAARKFGIDAGKLERFPRFAEIPFTSERKRHATVHVDRENPDDLRVFVKGAPEVLLAKCRFLWQNGKAVPLTEEGRANLLQRNEGLAKQALRTLAIATRTLPAKSLGVDPQAAAKGNVEINLPESVEDDLVLLGLVGMIDPPRTEARDAVITAKRAHIRTVMITGDHPATAEAIARELTIFEPGARIVTGSRAARHARRRTRPNRRAGARVRPRRSRAQAPDRRRAPAQGPHRRHDRRRHQRRTRAQVRQHRRRHGHHRHRRVQGSRRHGADRRQFRQHREGDRGRPRHLRQYPQVPALSAVVECRRTAHHVRGRDARRIARAHFGGGRACSCRCSPRNCSGSTSSPTARPHSRSASTRETPTSWSANRGRAAPASSPPKTGGGSPRSAR